MSKQRKDIPRMTQKRIYQEADSRCAFCREEEVTSLTIHHIDSNPGNNHEENLILVCSNCHGKITHAILSQADVALKKREIFWTRKMTVNKAGKTFSVVVDNSVITGDVANTITNISMNSGHFKWNSINDDELVDKFLNFNAPALLLSNIRSIITQLTAFSGFPALILPLYDFTK